MAHEPDILLIIAPTISPMRISYYLPVPVEMRLVIAFPVSIGVGHEDRGALRELGSELLRELYLPVVDGDGNPLVPVVLAVGSARFHHRLDIDYPATVAIVQCDVPGIIRELVLPDPGHAGKALSARAVEVGLDYGSIA